MSLGRPQSDSPHKCRRLQYSLRTLLVAVLLVSIAMSWVAVRIRKVKRQQVAAKAIENLGGTVIWTHQVDPLDRDLFWPDAKPPGPAWLRNLLGDDFFITPIDAQVSSSDAQLGYVRELGELQRLFLGGSSYLSQNTESSVAIGFGFTDRGLANIEGLSELRELQLWGTFTSDGLQHLKGLTSLQKLEMNGSRFTDDAFENFPMLKQLRELNLCGTQVTDAALRNFTGLTQLQVLHLGLTRVTAEGVENLQKALPNCKVIWTPPTKDEQPSPAAPDQPGD